MRAQALRITLEAAEFAGEIGAHMIIWPGGEGYNYPFQTPYAESWARLIDGIGAGRRARCAKHGRKLFLEHKNSEPAMKILMRNIGMTLHVIHKLRDRGIDNVQVNMDWQHLIMNGEHLPEYAALLAAEGLLGHQHANSGWGTFDDDNMVGATAFMETLELALELRRANYGANGERLGFDLYPYTEDQVGAVQALGAAVALHRLGRGADRRRRAARGAAAQGRRARLRARLRGARAPDVGYDAPRRARRRHLVGQGRSRSTRTARSLARRRGGVSAVDAASGLERAGPRATGGAAAEAVLDELGGRRGRRHRAVRPDARARRARRRRARRCARRSCGTTSARGAECARSRSASASSA